MTEEYKANQIAADAKYKDKILKVNGVVTDIGIDIVDRPYVSLEGVVFSSVRCLFDKQNEPQLAQLSKGQAITVQGRCDGYLFWVDVVNCVIVRSAPPPRIVAKNASELVLKMEDFSPGWRQVSAESAVKEGALSVYHVYFLGGGFYPPVVQNTVAVYSSIELAQEVYLSEKPTNVSLEYPKVGDDCFYNIAIPVDKLLVFRKSNVVVWVWAQQLGDARPYARIIEKRIDD